MLIHLFESDHDKLHQSISRMVIVYFPLISESVPLNPVNPGDSRLAFAMQRSFILRSPFSKY